MKKVLVLCPYPENAAPTQRLKYEQYFPAFRGHGYSITVSPFMSRRLWAIVYKKGRLWEKTFWVVVGYLRRILDLFRIPLYDGVYVSLQVTPFGGAFFERLVRLLAKGMIYDIDDLVFLGKTSKANRVTAFLKRPEKYFYLMAASDHVITCTPYLDSVVRKYNPRTTDISSTIRTDDYVPVNPYSNEKPLVLGWSGSHSTAPYLHLLDSVLKKLAGRHRFTLKVIGDPGFRIDGVNVKARAWREETEVQDLQEIDIGLYPLPDEEWVLGKSGLKALQYMSLGIPTVAAAVGANFRVIEDGASGFLVKSEEEWLDRIERLILDPGLRRRLGTAARSRVEAMYSIRANTPVYLEIFREVYGAP